MPMIYNSTFFYRPMTSALLINWFKALMIISTCGRHIISCNWSYKIIRAKVQREILCTNLKSLAHACMLRVCVENDRGAHPPAGEAGAGGPPARHASPGGARSLRGLGEQDRAHRPLGDAGHTHCQVRHHHYFVLALVTSTLIISLAQQSHMCHISFWYEDDNIIALVVVEIYFIHFGYVTFGKNLKRGLVMKRLRDLAI